MTAGLVLALLAQAASPASASAAPADASPAAAQDASPESDRAPKAADGSCVPPRPEAGTREREIVVCAPRKQSYRIDPDIREAERRAGSGDPPPKQDTAPRDKSCATVGPMGCRDGGINLLGAALFAGKAVAAAAKGENVGKLFVTDPQPNEYQLYLEAKRRREEREAEEAAKAAEPEPEQVPR